MLMTCPSGRFKRTLRAIERGDDMAFTQMIELRGSRPVPRMPYEIGPEDMGWHLLLTNRFVIRPCCYARDHRSRGGYRSVPAEDYDLWMRVASAGGRIRRLAPWGLLYRIHPARSREARHGVRIRGRIPSRPALSLSFRTT